MNRCRSFRRNAFYSLIANQTAPRVPRACLQWAAVALLAGGSKAVFGQTTYTFDPTLGGPSTGVPQDGSGTWDGITSDWYNTTVGTAGGSDVLWPNDGTSIAQFGDPSGTVGDTGTAGSVAVSENISAGGLILNQPANGNYTINATNDSISLGSSGLVVNGGSPTINIGSGQSLSNTGVTTIGNANFASTSLTVSGLGTWSTAPSGSTSFAVGKNSAATLNMSNLSNFVYNNPTFSSPTAGGEFDVGVTTSTTAPSGAATVSLAANSSITAAIVRIGDSEGLTSTLAPTTSTLNLGSGSTTIEAGVINIGGGSITGQGSINGATGTPASEINSGIVQFAGSTGSLTIGPMASATGAQALGPFINIGVGGVGTTNVSGTLNLDGHPVSINAASFDLGQRISGSANTTTGVLSFDTGTINVGTVYMSHVNGSGSGGNGSSTINIGSSPSSTELFDVNGSTYANNTNDFQFGNASTTSSTAYTATAVVNINGGTALINSNMYASHSGSLNSSHATLNLFAGTLNMNHNEIGGTGDFVTFNAQSGTLENVGAINRSSGTSAGLIKTTTGTLTLLGTNTWANQTTINGGTLIAGAANAMAPAATANINNGVLDVSSFANTIGGLDVTSTGTLNLGIGNLLTDSGPATFGGTLNISGTPTGSTVELMSYTSESGTFATVPSFAGYTLVYTPTELELAQGALALTWDDAGGSGDGRTWNTTQQNWNTGSAPSTYTDGLFITFNDTNNATSNGGTNPNAYNVTLNTTVSPGSVTVNNSSGNYSFTGTGSIAGTTSLVKNGTATLTIATPNTYSGGDVINTGAVVVNTGGTLGASTNALSLGTPVAQLGGTLTPTANLTLNTSVTVGSFSTETNNTTADILTIAPGATFTVNGTFLVGPINANTNSTNYSGALTATGGGALSVTGAGPVFVAQSSFNSGGGGKDLTTADMSGLNNVNINVSGEVGIGDYANSTGILLLADTAAGSTAPSNFINANEIDVGNTQNFNDAGTSTLTLGSGTNTLDANTINIGIGKTGGVINWSADSTASSSITIEGTGGGSAQANITLGEATASTYTAGRLAQLLLAGHKANVQTNTLIIGDAAGNTANGPNATVTFDTGVFNAEVVEVAADTGGTSTVGPTGALIIGGASPNTSATGVFTVGAPNNEGEFTLGFCNGGTAVATVNASLIINSGIVDMYCNILNFNNSTAEQVSATLTLAGNAVLNMEGYRIGNNLGPGSGDDVIGVNFAPNPTDSVTLENLGVNTGGNGVNNAGLTMNGQGTLTLLGTNTYSGTTVNSGTLVVGATGALPANDTVTINGGTLKLGSSTGLATISSLTITGSGTFDVNNDHVIINYGGSDPIASIAALLKTGYNGGNWNGAGGIISTAAQLNNATPGNLLYGLGYADSADSGNPAGLSANSIEIKYTLLGDANLSGVVDGTDFGIVAANFNKGVTGWDQGDFNYDNVVDGTDFGDLAANFNKGASGASVGEPAYDDPAIVAFAEAHGLMADLTSIPEPATAGLFVATGLGTLARRRRRH